MTDIFREVEEDVRQERYLKIWKRYGRYVVGAAVGVVAAVAAYVAWEDYRASQQEGLSIEFARAVKLAEDGAHDAALVKFNVLAKSSAEGYGVLARFRKAGLLVADEDMLAAIALYDELSADGQVDPLFRELAAFYAVLHSIDDAGANELETRLEPLIGDDNPWRYSARELKALIAYRAREIEVARTLLSQLVEDTAAPSALRTRAVELLGSLGGGISLERSDQ